MRSHNRWRTLLISAVALFSLYLTSQVILKVREEARHQEKVEEEQVKSRKSQGATSGLPSFKGFSFTEDQGEGRSFTLNAESFEVRNKKVRFLTTAMLKEAVMQKVEVNFYENKRLVSSIRAEHAVMDLTKMSAQFTGNVTVKTSAGKSLESEELLWLQRTGSIRVEGPYTYRNGDKVVKGKGLHADNHLTRVNFINPPEDQVNSH